MQMYVSDTHPFFFLLNSCTQIYYPIGNTLVGGGNQSSVTFPSHSNTTFTFPFSIAYTTTMPSSTEILADLISKCGLEGGTRSDITVDYVIKVHSSLFLGLPELTWFPSPGS